MKSVKVLFVCMGNICRSPTAEGVFTSLVSRDGQEESIEIDSAGTHAYHVGKGPDGRAEEAAGRRGFDLSPLRARTVKPDDFHQFDYILAMDSSNYDDLIAICPAGQEHRVKMFLEFAPQVSETEVPDPYYGGHSGFEHVLDLVEAASEGLLKDIYNRVEK